MPWYANTTTSQEAMTSLFATALRYTTWTVKSSSPARRRCSTFWSYRRTDKESMRIKMRVLRTLLLIPATRSLFNIASFSLLGDLGVLRKNLNKLGPQCVPLGAKIVTTKCVVGKWEKIATQETDANGDLVAMHDDRATEILQCSFCNCATLSTTLISLIHLPLITRLSPAESSPQKKNIPTYDRHLYYICITVK